MAAFRALVLVLFVTGEQVPPPPLLSPSIPPDHTSLPLNTSTNTHLYFFMRAPAPYHTPPPPPSQPHCVLPPSTSGSPSAVSPAVLTSASMRPAARARPSSSPLRLRAPRSVLPHLHELLCTVCPLSVWSLVCPPLPPPGAPSAPCLCHKLVNHAGGRLPLPLAFSSSALPTAPSIPLPFTPHQGQREPPHLGGPGQAGRLSEDPPASLRGRPVPRPVKGGAGEAGVGGAPRVCVDGVLPRGAVSGGGGAL